MRKCQTFILNFAIYLYVLLNKTKFNDSFKVSSGLLNFINKIALRSKISVLKTDNFCLLPAVALYFSLYFDKNKKKSLFSKKTLTNYVHFQICC